MLTTKYARDNLDAIRDSMKRRKSDYPLDELLELDEKYRAIKTKLQDLQAKRNKASLEISEMKKKSQDTAERIASLAGIKKEIEGMEKELPDYETEIDKLLWNMPNILHESVPYGEDATKNVEARKWGTPKTEVTKGHEEILTELNLIDIERAAKIAGARFFFLKGDLVLLEQSLIRFAVDELVKKGYMPMAPPLMLRRKYYRGVTALADFEDMLYRIGDPKEVENKKDYEKMSDELFLIGTSEHVMAAMHAEEVFSGNQLPLKYLAISPCFRREAGAHGKDTKGIFRVHQFYKVEQFIFCKQENSWKYFDEVVKNEEELFQKLNIPYHVLEICTGDIGTVAAKKVDLEAWMPSQQAYREVTSASNCTDWQSSRLDIKYDEKGVRKYAHTLNATAIATNRTIVAIVENYTNPDGTITIPEVLVPYMGKSKIG
jgi:seryl-tRNA synthetase